MVPAVDAAGGRGDGRRSGSTENKRPNFILPETYDSGFALRLLLKDMRIAAHLADVLDVPSRLGARAVELWAQAAAALPPKPLGVITAWAAKKDGERTDGRTAPIIIRPVVTDNAVECDDV
ncbi:hypothetical protein C1I97_36985, partial [Streptomyces sp. NTH33]